MLLVLYDEVLVTFLRSGRQESWIVEMQTTEVGAVGLRGHGEYQAIIQHSIEAGYQALCAAQTRPAKLPFRSGRHPLKPDRILLI